MIIQFGSSWSATRRFASAFTAVAMCVSFCAVARADEPPKSSGWLRERIKKRVMKRVEEKPAPEAQTDVSAAITQPGTYTFTFQHDGRARYYKLHVPKTYRPQTASALVVAMHGGGGDMEIQATDKYYGFLTVADREGFAVLFPNGHSKFKSGKIATWNAGKCCAWARDEKINDVDFIRRAVGHAQTQLKIDPAKIFATGMSNGAMMAYRLACEAPDLFRAIAAVAGTDNTESCKPTKAVSILHIHSLLDEHVKFTGGAGNDAAKSEFITDFASVPGTVEKWTQLNACKGPTSRVLSKKNVYCDQSANCRDGVTVKLCVTEDGGHSWPGGTKPMDRGPKPSRAINATEVAWEFFRTQ